MCILPAVGILTQRENDQIATRMREVAAAVGMKVAAEKCEPNALVIMVDDKQEFSCSPVPQISKLLQKWCRRFAKPSAQAGSCYRVAR